MSEQTPESTPQHPASTEEAVDSPRDEGAAASGQPAADAGSGETAATTPAAPGEGDASGSTGSAPSTSPATPTPGDVAPAAPTPAAPASPAAPTPTPAPPAAPAPTPAPPAAPTPAAPASPAAPTPAPASPAPAAPAEAAAPAAGGAPGAAPAEPSGTSDAASFGRVAEDGTVFVRTPEGEREVGSYPDASPEEALAYFARKYDEVVATADLLYQRVTQTDLSAKDATDSLEKLRATVRDLRAVGDLVALQNRVETIDTAVQARRVVESEQKAAQREEALAKREAIVAEAESIAAQEENKVQWKASSARMRALLDEWKAAQRGGPRLDRETEQGLWRRLSSSRNSFDKMRRVHFAHLGQEQAAAKEAKEELVKEAESLTSSTDWGATAGAYKRLMDRWRGAGRAARSDDDALWKRFKAAQDTFFARKDEVSAAENEQFTANLAVKEEILAQAQTLVPVKDLERTKRELRDLQEKWDAAGKVPRGDIDRMEKGMRRVEQAVRDAEDKKWKSSNPEVAARAASLASQAESALEKYRRDLEKAERSGDERRIAKAREALEAREAWLKQAQAGLAEFGG